MYREKTPVNFAFLFMDFTDFACFGHGLESFLKKGSRPGFTENREKKPVFFPAYILIRNTWSLILKISGIFDIVVKRSKMRS